MAICVDAIRLYDSHSNVVVATLEMKLGGYIIHHEAILDRWLVIDKPGMIMLLDCTTATWVPLGESDSGVITHLKWASISGPCVAYTDATYLVGIIARVSGNGDVHIMARIPLKNNLERILLCEDGQSYLRIDYETTTTELVDVRTAEVKRTFTMPIGHRFYNAIKMLTYSDFFTAIIYNCDTHDRSIYAVRISTDTWTRLESYMDNPLMLWDKGRVVGHTYRGWGYNGMHIADATTGLIIGNTKAYFAGCDSSGAMVFNGPNKTTRAVGGPFRDDGAILLGVDLADKYLFRYGTCLTWNDRRCLILYMDKPQ